MEKPVTNRRLPTLSHQLPSGSLSRGIFQPNQDRKWKEDLSCRLDEWIDAKFELLQFQKYYNRKIRVPYQSSDKNIDIFREAWLLSLDSRRRFFRRQSTPYANRTKCGLPCLTRLARQDCQDGSQSLRAQAFQGRAWTNRSKDLYGHQRRRFSTNSRNGRKLSCGSTVGSRLYTRD